MNPRRTLGVLLFLMVLAATGGCSQREAEPASGPLEEGFPLPTDFSDYIIETDELAELLGSPDLVILDGRLKEDYEEAHIPGAINLRWRDVRDLDTIIETGYPLPLEKAGEIFGGAGIDENTRVVVYDSGDGRNSAGVWFALKFFGHDRVQLLNGGLRKWVEEGRPVTSEVPGVEQKRFTPKPRPEMVVTVSYVIENKDSILLIDARSFEEIVGLDLRENPRGGHIPWAKWFEWKEIGGDLMMGELETFKPPEEMQRIFLENGITKDKEIILYCDSGQRRAPILYMALRMLGYENVKIYMGSFIDWSRRLELPVETTYKEGRE